MHNRPLDVGSDRQLFLDDHVIERAEGVQRQFHRPIRYTGNPIINWDRPWESGGGVYLYGGTVLFDEEQRLFKMWYRTSTPLVVASSARGYDEARGGYKACYAVSEDGLHWEKPYLGHTDYDGSTRNNLLPPSEDGMEFIRRPNLIQDYEEPDPRKRYKMLYMDKVGGQWGLSKAYSADGIVWRMNVGQPHRFQRPVAPNGILFGWDSNNQRYVHYHRKSGREPADVDGREVRAKLAVMRTTSPDFETWGETQEVLSRGEGDPPRWSPSHGVDLAGVLYTEDLYVGLVDTGTTHFVEDVSTELWESVHGREFAEYRTELLVSRDGIKWDRLAPHWEFFRPGLYDSWDRDHVALAKPIVHNDEIYIYYTGSPLALAANNPRHPQFDKLGKVVDGLRRGNAIGLAKMRLDGFASMDAYAAGGTLTTRPLVFEGDRLVVNARAPENAFGSKPTSETPHGILRVEVLDARSQEPLPGFGAAECDTFTGDDVHHAMSWARGAGPGQLQGKPVRLRFHMRNAALYAFQFTGRRAKPSPVNRSSPGVRGRPYTDQA